MILCTFAGLKQLMRDLARVKHCSSTVVDRILVKVTQCGVIDIGLFCRSLPAAIGKFLELKEDLIKR